MYKDFKDLQTVNKYEEFYQRLGDVGKQMSSNDLCFLKVCHFIPELRLLTFSISIRSDLMKNQVQ